MMGKLSHQQQQQQQQCRSINNVLYVANKLNTGVLLAEAHKALLNAKSQLTFWALSLHQIKANIKVILVVYRYGTKQWKKTVTSRTFLFSNVFSTFLSKSRLSDHEKRHRNKFLLCIEILASVHFAHYDVRQRTIIGFRHLVTSRGCCYPPLFLLLVRHVARHHMVPSVCTRTPQTSWSISRTLYCTGKLAQILNKASQTLE